MDKKEMYQRTNQFNRENYDQIRLLLKKGGKNAIKAHAELMGESMNAFINRAIKETMERDRLSAEGAGE